MQGGNLNRSIEMLGDKSDDMRDGLSAVAQAYRAAEHTNHRMMQDPAVRAVQDNS